MFLGGNCREILDKLGRRIDRTRQRLKFIKNIVACEIKEASRKQKKV